MQAENVLKAKNDFSLIIFGASGHLASLKIFPALYVMALKERFPKHFAVVGYARSAMDDASFRAHVADAVRKHTESVNEEILGKFLEHVYYQQGQYDAVEGFQELSTKLQEVEQEYSQDAVRLAYFSIPPSAFGAVAKHLCAGGVHSGARAFRCIVEKPLGHNFASFEQIRKDLTGCFMPKEIWLLDHYLGKEAARNIYYLRLINPIVERVLKYTLVTNVQITASESGGLEGREGYFEAVGTFRDMFQSHLLQLMALLTMQLTEREKLPQSRLDALKNIYVPPAAHLSEVVLQGQYIAGDGKPGYKEEKGVAQDSRTATFAATKLMTRMSRWQGTPFYLRSGKRLRGKETKIAFEFQNPYATTYDTTPNRMEIILQGEAGMRVHLQTKVGGSEPAFRPLILEDPLVCTGDCMDEHGLLLLEAVNGKQDWFLDFEEAATAWNIIDPLQAYLEQVDTTLHGYPCGSEGPEAAGEWIAKQGVEWI